MQTVGGIDGGGDGSVTVQLTHPFLCQLAGDGTATATIQEPQLKIYLTDAEFTTPIDVTDNEPVEVHVGESVTLTTGLNGQGPAATWVLPGNGEVIKSYVPTLPKNQLTQLGVAGVGVNAGSRVVSNSSSITFEWVGGGDFSVAATVAGTNGGSTTVYAGFFVQAPDVTVTATPTTGGENGTRISGKYQADFDFLQMARTIWTPQVPTGSESDWEYCFAQTITSRWIFTVPYGHTFDTEGGTYVPMGDRTGLDTKFPYTCISSGTLSGIPQALGSIDSAGRWSITSRPPPISCVSRTRRLRRSAARSGSHWPN